MRSGSEARNAVKPGYPIGGTWPLLARERELEVEVRDIDIDLALALVEGLMAVVVEEAPEGYMSVNELSHGAGWSEVGYTDAGRRWSSRLWR